MLTRAIVLAERWKICDIDRFRDAGRTSEEVRAAYCFPFAPAAVFYFVKYFT